MACSESDLLYYLDKSEAKSFIKLAGVRLFPSGYTYGPHKHDDIEIVCVDSGVCIIKFVNENKDVYVNKGEGIIIYPEVNHKFIIDDTAHSFTQHFRGITVDLADSAHTITQKLYLSLIDDWPYAHVRWQLQHVQLKIDFTG